MTNDYSKARQVFQTIREVLLQAASLDSTWSTAEVGNVSGRRRKSKKARG